MVTDDFSAVITQKKNDDAIGDNLDEVEKLTYTTKQDSGTHIHGLYTMMSE